MFELILEREGETQLRQRLGPEPVLFGRAPTNHVMLSDETVSGRHAAAWASGSRAWVEDLGSKNGTWLNGERIRGVVPLSAGDEIRLGHDTRLQVREVPGDPAGLTLGVEDVGAGVKWPIRGARFRIGSDPTCDLALDHGPPLAATLLVDPDGEPWLGIDDDTVELRVGVSFEVAGRTLVIRPLPAGVSATREAPGTPAPGYSIEATLDGPTGPRATVRDDATGLSHTFDGSNRAILLFLLARQHAADGEAGIGGADQGWCDEESVGVGIWGRAAADRSLNVLVCRVRKELRLAGLDPWFIEKRRRHLRARVSGVILG